MGKSGKHRAVHISTLLGSIAICCLTVTTLQPLARASVVYEYTGVPMDGPVWAGFTGDCPAPCTMSGSLTFTDAIPASSTGDFSTSLLVDGVEITTYDFQVDRGDSLSPYDFNPGDVYETYFHLVTDPLGQISGWSISLHSTILIDGSGGSTLGMGTTSYLSSSDELTGSPNWIYLQGSIVGIGTWSGLSDTPEPRTAFLLMIGLAAFLAAPRRK